MRRLNPAAVRRTIDAYLKPVDPVKRGALPKGEECISYGIPSFRLDGTFLLAFGAASKHCAFYPGAFAVREFKDELKVYSTSKGTIRFQPNAPLPVALVRKLIKARVAWLKQKQN